MAASRRPFTATRWRTTTTGRELPGQELPRGMFGESFTIDDGGQGLLEESVHLGDWISIGTAEVTVTQPLLPCYKLGVRFGSDDMVKRFLASGRTGFYVAVVREGEVGAGHEIKVIAREPNAFTISEITRLYDAKRIVSAARSSSVPRRKTSEVLNDASFQFFLWDPMLARLPHGLAAFCDARITSVTGPNPRKGTSRGTSDLLSDDTDRWTLHLL